MMNNSQKQIALGILVFILCSMAFYFFYWIKTPAYSLSMVRDAVQKHDVQAFEKHVDLDTLLPKAFDDALVAQGKITGENLLDNAFTAAIVQAMKPGVVSMLKAETLSNIQGKGNDSEVQGKNNDQKKMANGLKEKTDFQNSEIKEVSTLSKEDNIAIVSTEIYNKKLNKTFTVNFKMAKLDDGTWKVKEISNFVNFLVEIDKAEKDKLAEINKPIKEKIDKILKMKGGNGSIDNDGNPFFATHWITFNTNFKNIGDKDITSFRYVISISKSNDSSKKELAKFYCESNNYIAKGKTIMDERSFDLNPFIPNQKTIIDERSFDLNPFIPNQKTIIDLGLSGSKIDITIYYIHFANGNAISLYSQIPDEKEE